MNPAEIHDIIRSNFPESSDFKYYTNYMLNPVIRYKGLDEIEILFGHVTKIPYFHAEFNKDNCKDLKISFKPEKKDIISTFKKALKYIDKINSFRQYKTTLKVRLEPVLIKILSENFSINIDSLDQKTFVDDSNEETGFKVNIEPYIFSRGHRNFGNFNFNVLKIEHVRYQILVKIYNEKIDRRIGFYFYNYKNNDSLVLKFDNEKYLVKKDLTKIIRNVKLQKIMEG